MATIAIVGLGDMGEQMVRHLLAAGHQVRVSDAAEPRLETARLRGATAVASAAEAAWGADVIFGLVMSTDLPSAYLGNDGIFAGAQPGASVLICSATTRAVIEYVRGAAPSGVVMLDSPIVGGVESARERAITFLVGGPADDFERVRPVLDELGRPWHVGEFGAGVDYKLITNVAIMAAEAGLREALDLADFLGRDHETSLEVMAAGPMKSVVERALAVSSSRPLRRSAEDNTPVAAGEEPARVPQRSTVGRHRFHQYRTPPIVSENR